MKIILAIIEALIVIFSIFTLESLLSIIIQLIEYYNNKCKNIVYSDFYWKCITIGILFGIYQYIQLTQL